MEKIPFETEINNFLKELFYENWIDENDWQMLLKEANISIENLSNDLQTGLKNGYSIEEQFDLIRFFFQRKQHHCELYDFGRKDKPCDKKCDSCKAMNLD